MNFIEKFIKKEFYSSILLIFVTILLLSDAFFLDMAVVIMFGLGFTSVLTLIVVPVLYSIFFNIKASA